MDSSKKARHRWRAAWAFPSLEIFLYLLDKTFPDTGPDLGFWSVYGAVFEWKGLLFYGISPFLLLVLTVSYFSIDLIISRHDTRHLDI